jgi:hypothetical protein
MGSGGVVGSADGFDIFSPGPSGSLNEKRALVRLLELIPV